MGQFLGEWEHLLWSAVALSAAVAFGLLVHSVLYRIATRVGKKTGSVIDDFLVRWSRRPARALFPLLALTATLPFLPLSPGAVTSLRRLAVLGLIATVGWAAMSLIGAFDELLSSRYPVNIKDNLAARRIQTRIRVLRRIGNMLVAIVTASVMLLTFPGVRQIGLGLLGSAGLAGLVIGMAARPTLSNIIAGIQIALTEPIRIDDAVVVEGEWGWIEEITTAYVVVRIWDLRRLIVPLSYFIEQPFQNWTRQSADILGTAYIYVDYTTPVEEVREELHRILEATELWDRKAWGLQVTNATEHTLELRCLMSAPDSGTAWNLRCYVREKLIAYLQETHPQCLPKARAEIENLGSPASHRDSPARPGS